MAIYDNNGTTSSEIGKLYDNNGTTSAQIGKVYDNNGTTNSLIYSAEQVIFGGGTDLSVNNYVCTTDGSSGAWITGTESTHGNIYCKITKTAGSSIALYGNNSTVGYNSALVVSSSTVPSKDFSTMKVTYKNSGAMTSKKIGIGLKSSSGNTDLTAYGTYKTGTSMDIRVTAQTSNKTVSLDISSVTTNQYLFICLYNPAQSTEGTVTISSIVFE